MLEKSGYLYHCSFALILWLLLWGTFSCAELSVVCVCCTGCLCGLLLLWSQVTPPACFFASCLESRLLLTGSVGKLVFAEICTENLVFHGGNKGWVALQQTGIALYISKMWSWSRPLVDKLPAVIQHYSRVLIFPCPLSSVSNLIVKSDCSSLDIKRIFPHILQSLLSPDDFEWCARRGLLNPQSEVRSFYSSA